MACEGLSNAIKHAGASRVEISASVSAGSLVLIVVDDGVGGASVAGGTGLQGLADRVESAGGTLTVVSPVGEGTTLKAELPCGS